MLVVAGGLSLANLPTIVRAGSVDGRRTGRRVRGRAELADLRRVEFGNGGISSKTVRSLLIEPKALEASREDSIRPDPFRTRAPRIRESAELSWSMIDAAEFKANTHGLSWHTRISAGISWKGGTTSCQVPSFRQSGRAIGNLSPSNSGSTEEYDCTRALPGSDEKVKVLAARIAQGLPLWHPSDRRAYREDDD